MKANRHAVEALDIALYNRGRVRNVEYAALQAQLGNFAGTDEVCQWLELPENRHKTVVIIDLEPDLDGKSTDNEHIDIFTLRENPQPGEDLVKAEKESFTSQSANAQLDQATVNARVAAAVYGDAAPNQAGERVIPENRIVLHRTAKHFNRILGVK